MTATQAKTYHEVCCEIKDQARAAHQRGEVAYGSGSTSPRLAGEFGRRLHIAQAEAGADYCRAKADAARIAGVAACEPQQTESAASPKTARAYRAKSHMTACWLTAEQWAEAADHFVALAEHWAQMPADKFADLWTWGAISEFFRARGWTVIALPPLGEIAVR